MAMGVVISAAFIGVFVGEAVTVMDGRVGRGREEDGEVAREGEVGGRLLSGEVLSGLVMVARVTRACTVEAVILMPSNVEEEEEVMVVGVEAVQEFSTFCEVVSHPCNCYWSKAEKNRL